MTYDLNGRLAPQTRMARLFGRFSRRSDEGLTPEHPDLVPVAQSDDDAAASSSVLDAATAFDPLAQSVLRHVLELPSGSVDEVLRLVAQEGYVRVPDAGGFVVGGGAETVAVARVQTIDALHVSQERSRMAGLTARHDGRAVLWQVLQLPVAPPH